MHTFADTALHPALIQATQRLGFTHPTPIQARALPPILAGHDVIAQAKTGSGKTAAFGLGILQRLADPPPPGPPTALVLGPTRELADQVAHALRQLAQCTPNTRVVTLCGGQPLRPQKNALSQGAHIVVGTPGRVADHLERGHLDLSRLTTLVLDEADRMLDMGFIDQVSGIARHCPQPRQTLLFSATFPTQVEALGASLQHNPVSVSVDTTVSAAHLRQEVVHCDPPDRFHTIASVLAAHNPESALLFCETRHDCEDLRHYLQDRGASVLALHGGLEQRERDDVLVQFSNGSARFLVATDVAARGLDIPALPLVIQAELSPDPEVHTHRIGRTARAGEQGCAVAIVASAREQARLERIQDAHNHVIPVAAPPTHTPRFQRAQFRTLLLLAGRKHKLRKGDVLGALVKDGGIPPGAIGQIHLAQRTCAVAVLRSHAVRALRYMRRGRVKKMRVRATLLGD